MPERIAFDHVALGVPAVAETMAFVVGELGARPDQGGPAPEFTGGQWAFEGGGKLEILEPAGRPGGFMHRFVEKSGGGIHHVTFKVPSLAATCDRARALGYEIVGYNDAYPGWKEAFLHPRQALGIVVQMAESDPRFGDSWGADWEPPPGPANPPPPVRLVGLRMRATDAARVRRQWSELLEGECAEHGRELRFRWPGSPLRIAVELRPGEPDGPLALELESDRPLRLPEGPHPTLHCAFVRVG
jgi:methylmalonyl-CoA/ethylmalonyl-CoA epimerase